MYSICPTNSGTGNNGNLKGYVAYHGGQAIAQQFGYDGLNRLTSVSDSGGYSRSFGYDAYGNMAVQGYSGIGLSSLTPYSGNSSNPFDGNNRLLNADYDGKGNQTRVGSLRIGYDAENRQRSLTDSLDATVSVQYQYDGEGNRVSKSIPTATTVYVYDAFGQLAAEYSNAAVAASPCSTCYLAYDHLGSVRMVMDQAGNVVSRHDYLPFGEEVAGGSAGRNNQFGASDGVKQKFTGQERDGGTVPNLDYFYARYFNGEQGRFLSPDPGNAGADPMNPQSWNGYAYAANSPMVFTDPTGMMTSSSLWGFFSEVGNRVSSWFGAGGGGQDPSYCLSYGGFDCAPGARSTGLGRNSSAASGNDGLIPLFTATGVGKRDVATVSTPPNTGTQKSCSVQRVVAAANGFVSLGVGLTKARLAAASALSIPATGPLGAFGAAYGAIGASGNIAAGFLQLGGAVTGNVTRFGQAANVATTLTTAGGFSVWLATRGNIDAASTAANFESLGTAGVNGGMTGHFVEQGATWLEKAFLSTDLGHTAADSLGLNTNGSCR